MENFLDSRKRKSSDSSADAIKVSFQSECESDTVLSGRRVVELGLLSKELADGCNYCISPLQLSNCCKETVSGLGSFLYIILWESFHWRKCVPGDLLLGVRNDCFLLFLLIYVRKKSYREKSIYSHHSWTQNCLLGIMHLWDICLLYTSDAADE